MHLISKLITLCILSCVQIDSYEKSLFLSLKYTAQAWNVQVKQNTNRIKII